MQKCFYRFGFELAVKINDLFKYVNINALFFLKKIVYFFMYSKNENDYLYMQGIVLNYP